MLTDTQISIPPQPKAWSKNIAQIAQEFELTPLSLLSGHIPEGIRGTLYRNGPGRLERGGQKVGHWFDGDGAILAVHFQEGQAQAVYRYVQTQGYRAETKANRFLYANYGMTDPQGIWHYWQTIFKRQNILKNAANTSVLALPNKLLALWEGGLPHALDLETLETLGIENFGQFPLDQPYSAHPLRDPITGDIFSIGVDMQGRLHLYRSDRRGTILKHQILTLKSIPFLHSFCLAGPYLIFFIPPMKLDKLGLLLGTKAYVDAIEWQANTSTKILVLDRENFEIVSQGEAAPWFQWHYGNGCVEADGNIRLDLVKFQDFNQTNEYLREMPTGQTKTLSQGHLWQLRLNPLTGQILESQAVLTRSCEFPVIDPRLVGQPWRQTYVAVQRPGVESAQEWFGAIAAVDYGTGQVTEADLGEGLYPVEPLYIPDRINPEQGWIITVVYDGIKEQSEVWIWNSDRLEEEPVCRLGLPQIIPFSYHGTWRPF
ncbi:MAG: carotenoid oxygenase family protein [Snowella sp.]|nr:carotenoid oxygenase family protein [Snowella sp.]